LNLAIVGRTSLLVYDTYFSFVDLPNGYIY